MHLKLPQKSDSENSRSNGDLTGNKITDTITKLHHRKIQKQIKKRYI